MQRVERRSAGGVLGGAVAMTLVQAAPAWAHGGSGTDGLVAGLQHPVLGIDHLLAMVVVGVLGSVLARPLAAPVAFVLAMAAGGSLGIATGASAVTEIAIALSVLALGGAVVAGRALRSGPALGLVALAGVVHGHAHGAELPAGASATSYAVGFLVVTAGLHAGGVLGGRAVRHRVRARAALGAAVAGAGVGLLAGVL
jgi:urease accessory protein